MIRIEREIYRPDEPIERLPPFSVVIPVYNEERAIKQTIDQLDLTLSKLQTDYEIIVVNDGSSDGTTEALRECSGVIVVEHHWNQGYGAALKTGIQTAQYDLIVITDSDGTYPNELIPHLVTLAETADMVVGARTGANVQYPWLRRIPKMFMRLFSQWIAHRKIPDLNSGLRVFRKSIVRRFLAILPDGFSFTTTITLAFLTNHYKVHYEPINYHARVGQSKIRPIQDTLNFFRLIFRTGLYFAPLRVFLPIAACFFIGFGFSLCRDLLNTNISESTLLMLIASAQLGMFSLLADMIDKRMEWAREPPGVTVKTQEAWKSPTL